ncbi:MAG TPA: zf-HC2 domain-containing protein [Thermoanaerobaculia bacterium]|nr:zf-HC2 domain-containing protein [Thermoanaerobaculia bacterium]
MTDDADELDRRLARLFEEGRRREDPEDHPAPEKLSAYQAKELPPEEADAIQEHLVQCAFCTELLLDLEGFLEPQEEEAREGVADLGAEAGWRKVREEMGWKGRSLSSPTVSRGFFASALGGYSVAAALLVAAIGLAAWNLNLSREMRRPQPSPTMRTLEVAGGSRGIASSGEDGPVNLPAEITLNLPTDNPDARYRVDLFPGGSDRPAWSLDLPTQGLTLSLLLPEKALPTGRCVIRVSPLGKDGASRAWTYELPVGSSGP